MWRIRFSWASSTQGHSWRAFAKNNQSNWIVSSWRKFPLESARIWGTNINIFRSEVQPQGPSRYLNINTIQSLYRWGGLHQIQCWQGPVHGYENSSEAQSQRVRSHNSFDLECQWKEHNCRNDEWWSLFRSWISK